MEFKRVTTHIDMFKIYAIIKSQFIETTIADVVIFDIVVIIRVWCAVRTNNIDSILNACFCIGLRT